MKIIFCLFALRRSLAVLPFSSVVHSYMPHISSPSKSLNVTAVYLVSETGGSMRAFGEGRLRNGS